MGVSGLEAIVVLSIIILVLVLALQFFVGKGRFVIS